MRIKDSLAVFVLASSFNLGARVFFECSANVQTGIHLLFGCHDERNRTLIETLGHPNPIWVPKRASKTVGMHVWVSSLQSGAGSEMGGCRR